MKKDELTKDFEDMLKTYPFIRFNDFSSCGREDKKSRLYRDRDYLYLQILPEDSDEEILNNVMKCIEMAQEMQKQKAEIDAYRRQNPNLKERFEHIAWSLRE